MEAYRHQLAQPENADIALSRPFLDFSYALCEAKSDKNFIRFLADHHVMPTCFNLQNKTHKYLVFKQLLSYTLHTIVNDLNDIECFSAWDHYYFPHISNLRHAGLVSRCLLGC